MPQLKFKKLFCINHQFKNPSPVHAPRFWLLFFQGRLRDPDWGMVGGMTLSSSAK
jgi:hypothetical protein